MKSPCLNKEVYIVIDVGFGDSGKGLTTDYLCSKSKNPLVIRFASGHQCGHTVEYDNFKHMICNFGAGTLRGVPSYYSENTTILPPAIGLEYVKLKRFRPKLFIHPLAMVTTAYDIIYNHAVESINKHGSCGLGYGATIERNIDGIKLFAKDINNTWILSNKLEGIKYYYEQKIKLQDEIIQEFYAKELQTLDDDYFITKSIEASQLWELTFFEEIESKFSSFIFEGNQGIMLDRYEGIYPHNSWSECTSAKALEFIENYNLSENVNIFYVTRCYQTRHGNGPMSSDKEISLVNVDESNIENTWQGKFRTRTLDPSLIDWALNTDKVYLQKSNLNYYRNLMITCLDQVPSFNVLELVNKLKFEGCVYTNNSPRSDTVKLFY